MALWGDVVLLLGALILAVIVLAYTSSPKTLSSGRNGRSKSRRLENNGVSPTTAFCAVNILKRTVVK